MERMYDTSTYGEKIAGSYDALYPGAAEVLIDRLTECEEHRGGREKDPLVDSSSSHISIYQQDNSRC